MEGHELTFEEAWKLAIEGEIAVYTDALGKKRVMYPDDRKQEVFDKYPGINPRNTSYLLSGRICSALLPA